MDILALSTVFNSISSQCLFIKYSLPVCAHYASFDLRPGFSFFGYFPCLLTKQWRVKRPPSNSGKHWKKRISKKNKKTKLNKSNTKKQDLKGLHSLIPTKLILFNWCIQLQKSKINEPWLVRSHPRYVLCLYYLKYIPMISLLNNFRLDHFLVNGFLFISIVNLSQV